MEKVIQTEMTMEQAHDALETFFAGVYGNSNRTNKLNSPNHLVYKGIYKDIASFGTGIWKIHANHNIDVYFKEGRCKVKITCDVADVHPIFSGIFKIVYHENFLAACELQRQEYCE